MQVTFCGEKVANLNVKILTIFFQQYGSAKKPVEEKITEDEQTLAELCSAHRSSQA